MQRFLYLATIAFLALPYALFFGGWLRLPYALGTLALLGGGIFAAMRSAYRDSLADPEAAAFRPSRRELLIILLPVLVLLLMIGVGGLGWQDTDWLRGNAVFRDLVEKPWPVVYEPPSGPILLVYYVGYYLPAAAVGKVLGWGAANLALLAYTAFGLSLAALWVRKISGVQKAWVVPLFFAFAGMDVLGATTRLLGELATGSKIQSWRYMEWWAGYGVACYPANLDILVFCPNQALPAWLLTALVLSDGRAGRLGGTGILYLGLATLWAPYVAMGLLPCIAVLVFPRTRQPGWLREPFTAANATGLLLGLTLVGYFSSRFFPYSMPIDVSGLHQEHFTLTLLRHGPRFLVLYPLFVAFEFGILHALFYAYLRQRSSVLDPSLRALLVLSTAVLLFLPWINLSWNNDIVMRASLPMLVTTVLVAIRVLDDALPGKRPELLRKGVLLALAVGWINTASIAGRQLEGIAKQGSLVHVPEQQGVKSLFELQSGRYDNIGYNFVGQYLGSVRAPFARQALDLPPRDESPPR